MATDLKALIRDVPDFPKPGIVFKDLTPVIQDAEGFNTAIDRLAAWARPKQPEIIVGIESRGFLFAAGLARELRLGLAIIRKKGKLPRRTVCVKAPNEYAVEHFEMHEDAIRPGERVLVIDDLIATGQSSISAVELVARLGGRPVGFGAVVELTSLQGIGAIHQVHPDLEVFSLEKY